LIEAEQLMRRVVSILENPSGEPLPNYAGAINNLAKLLKNTNRLAEAEPLMRRVLVIVLKFTHDNGHLHPHFHDAMGSYVSLLQSQNRTKSEILTRLAEAATEAGYSAGEWRELTARLAGS
jgi:acyl-CoA synthetase (AMP-forming)/AMP-acid ligase II